MMPQLSGLELNIARQNSLYQQNTFLADLATEAVAVQIKNNGYETNCSGIVYKS
jgi:hypothetical protein